MNKKRILSIVLTIALSLGLAAVPMGLQYSVDASEAYQKVEFSSGSVNAVNVNLRTGPATTYTVVCKLDKDEKVVVMGKLGDWYSIYVPKTGNVGAVLSKYITATDVKPTAKQDTKNNDTKTTGNASNTAKAADKSVARDSANTKKTDTNTSSNKKPTATVAPQVKGITTAEQTLLDMINKVRKSEGLQPLQFDEELVKIARLKASDMKNNNYFGHNSPSYGSPFDMMKKYGVKFSIAGENIAGNQTMEKALKAWIDENGNNLFNSKFTHTGIGIVDSTTYGKLFVEMFIKK